MKNALRKVVSLSGFYLLFPLILLTVVFTVEYFSLPTSVGVVSIIVVFVAYVVHLLSLGNTWKSEEMFAYRNILFCITTFFPLLLYVNRYYDHNEITLVVFVLYLGSVVIALVIAIMAKGRDQEQKFSLFFGILTVLTGVFASYVYWGTQWIWMVSGMAYVLCVLQMNPKLDDELKLKAYAILALLCSVLSIVSTICQLWTVQIIGSLTFGRILVGVVCIVVFLFTGIYLAGMTRRKLLKKEQEEERLRIKTEIDEKNKRVIEECVNRLTSLQSEIISKGRLTVKEYEKLNEIQGHYRFPNSISVDTLPYALCLSFVDLVEVSEIKKQIVWNRSQIESLLERFNLIAKQSNKDAELAPIVEWVKKFEAELENYKQYKGYDACKKILTLYNALYSLVHPEEEKAQ